VTPKVTDERRPPAWAESVLRALLEPRNRDSVSGDLLEEYCEVVLPARGERRAKVWYIRQVASFVTALPFGPRDPLGNMPRDLQFFGNPPTMLVPVLVMFSAVLGTIGALFGRAFGSDRATSTHG
jgi:hypothetical protein